MSSTRTWVAAVVFLFGLGFVATASSRAVFVSLPPGTPETPGVAVPIEAAPTGTVIKVRDAAFADTGTPPPINTGVLRSFVADRGGGLLDFYYQLVSTSAPIEEIFRMKTTGGFTGFALSVAQTSSLAGLVAGPGSGFVGGGYTQGAGLEDASTADRDVGTLGSVGFDFSNPPAFLGSPENVSGGESSTFLIVRTNATNYQDIPMAISGSGGTSIANSFAAAPASTPVPEPVTATLGMMGVASLCLAVLRRHPRR